MVEESLAALTLIPPGRRELVFGVIPVEAPPILYVVAAIPEEGPDGERRTLYASRVYDARTGDRVDEKPYSSTYPDAMGRWLHVQTGEVPPEELGGEKALEKFKRRKS